MDFNERYTFVDSSLKSWRLTLEFKKLVLTPSPSDISIAKVIFNLGMLSEQFICSEGL